MDKDNMLRITIVKLHTGLWDLFYRLTDVGIYSFVHQIVELARKLPGGDRISK